MEFGVLVLYPPGCFLIRVVEWAQDPSTGTVSGLPDPFPVFSIGHTGDVTRATHRGLLDKGISQPMFLAILHTVVQHTVWFSRRDWLTSLSVLPRQLVDCRRDAARQLHLARLLNKHVPLNRFHYMSTEMVCHRVWPEVSILRTLYDEGILSSHIKLRVPNQTRHTPDVGAYMQAPPLGATYLPHPQFPGTTHGPGISPVHVRVGGRVER